MTDRPIDLLTLFRAYAAVLSDGEKTLTLIERDSEVQIRLRWDANIGDKLWRGEQFLSEVQLANEYADAECAGRALGEQAVAAILKFMLAEIGAAVPG